MNSYVKVEDWRVKENATVTYSVGGLILSNSGAVTANYWLSEIYDQEIADAHRNADIHLHDLSMLTGYCAGWSLKQLITEGLGGIEGKITSAPAKHLSVLCNQMVNFLVPVHLVVAQAHREGVHLRLRQGRAAEAVDVLQVPRLKDRLGLLGCFDDLHVVSLLICSVWA